MTGWIFEVKRTAAPENSEEEIMLMQTELSRASYGFAGDRDAKAIARMERRILESRTGRVNAIDAAQKCRDTDHESIKLKRRPIKLISFKIVM